MGPSHAGPPVGARDVALGLLSRVRLANLTRRYPGRGIIALFGLVNGFLSIAIMAAVALITDEPFAFPSLGPTAFLFFYTPTAPTASPRNAIYGHAIGASVGYLCLVGFGLNDEGPATAVGVSFERVLAAGLSLGLTSFFMVLANAPHPPAGATTLIISLGVFTEFRHVVVLMIAVALITTQAIVINRLAGIDYPLWSVRKPPPMPAS